MKDINPEEINAHMIDKLFDRIIATPVSDTEMDLVFVYNGGNTISRKYSREHAQSVGGHSGDTFKEKMEITSENGKGTTVTIRMPHVVL